VNKNIGIISNNLNTGEYLTKYLKHEDICRLNNPKVLEEILESVEKSVLSKAYHRDLHSKITSALSAISSIPCLIKEIPLDDFTKHIKQLLRPAFRFYSLNNRLKVIIIIPAFFISLFVFSPDNTNKTVYRANIKQLVEAPPSSKVTANEKQATLPSAPVTLETTQKQTPPTIVKNLQAMGKIKEENEKNNSGNKPTNNTDTNKRQAAPAKTKEKTGTNRYALNKPVSSQEKTASRSDERTELSDILQSAKKKLNMKATAYDLSVKSCKKTPDHPAYGITKSGTRVTVGRTVAVDPAVIPLKSRLYISFPEKYKHLDGIYVAEDVGSLVKGNKVDIYFGEDKPGEQKVYNEAKKFGVQNVEVYILQ
jgi:3D (Asp-Asp-Asp) domain-containing protein